MAGQHLPADHSRGDANTIGGYAAAHGRPAAFEGTDGLSYSVEIETCATGDDERPWGAFLLFVRWGRIGGTAPIGHLESEFLAEADTEDDARSVVGALPLAQVRGLLHDLIARESGARPTRKWFDAIADADEEIRE